MYTAGAVLRRRYQEQGVTDLQEGVAGLTNVIKIALCHLLMKYDWRFEPGEDCPPPPTVSKVGSSVSYAAQLQCQRRREEVDLDNLM